MHLGGSKDYVLYFQKVVHGTALLQLFTTSPLSCKGILQLV
jgi:hypothetical protein